MIWKARICSADRMLVTLDAKSNTNYKDVPPILLLSLPYDYFVFHEQINILYYPQLSSAAWNELR